MKKNNLFFLLVGLILGLVITYIFFMPLSDDKYAGIRSKWQEKQYKKYKKEFAEFLKTKKTVTTNNARFMITPIDTVQALEMIKKYQTFQSSLTSQTDYKLSNSIWLEKDLMRDWIDLIDGYNTVENKNVTGLRVYFGFYPDCSNLNVYIRKALTTVFMPTTHGTTGDLDHFGETSDGTYVPLISTRNHTQLCPPNICDDTPNSLWNRSINRTLNPDPCSNWLK